MNKRHNSTISIKMRRAFVEECYLMGLMPRDIREHIRREWECDVSLNAIYADIKLVRRAHGHVGQGRRDVNIKGHPPRGVHVQ